MPDELFVVARAELAELEVTALAEKVQIIRVPVGCVIISVVNLQSVDGRGPAPADEAVLPVAGGDEIVGELVLLPLESIRHPAPPYYIYEGLLSFLPFTFGSFARVISL